MAPMILPDEYTFTIPQGVLTATVLPAIQSEAGVDSFVPVVRIDGTVKVFGSVYTLRVTYQWEAEAWPVFSQGRETGARTHWMECQNYPHNKSSYVRLSSGREAAYRSPSYEAMRAMVSECLARLQAEHPLWQQQSVILRMRECVNEAHNEARAARVTSADWLVTADNADNRAAALTRELAAMISDLDIATVTQRENAVA